MYLIHPKNVFGLKDELFRLYGNLVILFYCKYTDILIKIVILASFHFLAFALNC